MIEPLKPLAIEDFPGLGPGATPKEPPLLTLNRENLQLLAQSVIALTNRVNELTALLNAKGQPAATADPITDDKPAPGANDTKPETKSKK